MTTGTVTAEAKSNRRAVLAEVAADFAPLLLIAGFALFGWCLIGAGRDYIAAVQARFSESEAPMYHGDDVKVMNLQGSGAFAFGQECFVTGGSEIVKIAVDGTQVFVRLKTAPQYPRDPAACPPGTLFLMEALRYVRASDELRDERDRAKEERERAVRLQERAKRLQGK